MSDVLQITLPIIMFLPIIPVVLACILTYFDDFISAIADSYIAYKYNKKRRKSTF